MTENWTELRVSNDAENDPDELQRRLGEDGYLFFRRLQDPDKLTTLRREMLTVMQEGGWLAAGSDPLDGIADLDARCTEGDVEYTDVYHQVYKLESFHRAAHWPEVTGRVAAIMGRAAMPLPQKVARLWFPQFTKHTTPTHQDYVHFQGSFDTLTCWAPVGDCPRELGGLAVLRGSHKVADVLDHHFSLGAGSLNLDPGDHQNLDDLEWQSTDFAIGDSLIFPALTVHKALPNITTDRLRVSLDNRYHPVGEPLAEHMLAPHLNIFNQLTWDDVYEGWESDELKYYWHEIDNPVVARDMAFLDKGFDEAVNRARQGDADARLYLRRFIKRDPGSAQAKAALEALGTEP